MATTADIRTELDAGFEARRRGSRFDMVRSRSARAEFIAQHQRWISDAMHSLWFKPAMAMMSALLIGAVLSQITVTPDSWLWPFTFHGDSSDARQLLVVITGTMITVTSLVFALTVVALQIASTQFSPRLLRTFLRDSGTQLVLSGFVGTVSFSLAGLFTVGTGNEFVPRVAVTVALAWALMSVGLLVYYIGHITNAIRIDTVMRTVEADTRRTLERVHPLVEPGAGDPDLVLDVKAPPGAVLIRAPVDGYMQGVDNRLLTLASRKRLVVKLIPLVGHYVVTGREVALVWSEDGASLRATTVRAVTALSDIKPERRIENEFGLGLRQLVDIVNRAMSTGQNDPYTGTQAVHHLTSVLVDASQRSFATMVRRDAGGTARVYVPIMGFPTHLKVVCGHIRQGGLERHPRVVLELLRMLNLVGQAAVGEARRQAVRREVELIMSDANRMIPTQADLDEALDLGKDVLRALDEVDTTDTTPAMLGR